MKERRPKPLDVVIHLDGLQMREISWEEERKRVYTDESIKAGERQRDREIKSGIARGKATHLLIWVFLFSEKEFIEGDALPADGVPINTEISLVANGVVFHK